MRNVALQVAAAVLQHCLSAHWDQIRIRTAQSPHLFRAALGTKSSRFTENRRNTKVSTHQLIIHDAFKASAAAPCCHGNCRLSCQANLLWLCLLWERGLSVQWERRTTMGQESTLHCTEIGGGHIWQEQCMRARRQMCLWICGCVQTCGRKHPCCTQGCVGFTSRCVFVCRVLWLQCNGSNLLELFFF